jgi:NADPH2:quinone reductase
MKEPVLLRPVGDDVSDIKLGDRVAFVTGQGAYAEAIILPASAVVRLPDDIEDEQACRDIAESHDS